MFACSEVGTLILATPTEVTLRRTQQLFAAAAKKAKIRLPAQVAALIKRAFYPLSAPNYADNDKSNYEGNDAGNDANKYEENNANYA